MARLVYACRFEVSSNNGANPVVEAYRGWLVRHYRERRGLPNFEFDPSQTLQADGLTADHSLISIVYANETGELYTFFDNEKIQIVAPAVLPISPVPSSNLIQVYLEPLRRLSTAPPQPRSHTASTQSGPPCTNDCGHKALASLVDSTNGSE